MASKKTSTERNISREGDLVTVEVTVTTVTTKPGQEPTTEVKKTEEHYSYNGKDGLATLPDDLRKALEESNKPIDPALIDKTASESNFSRKALEQINKYRKIHDVKPLHKSDDLKKYAKERAEEMAKADKSELKNGDIGEYVLRLTSNDPKHRVTAEQVTKNLYEQGKDYKYGQEPDSKHLNFAQMIWKETEDFAAAAAKSNTNCIYVVFAYKPVGARFVGTFTKNVLPPNSAGVSPLFKTVSPVNAQDSFNSEGIKAHNEYRARHGVPALTFSNEAANLAQDWANHLASTGQFEHRPNSGFGENLFFVGGAEGTAKMAIDSWYNEISKYNFDDPKFSSETGHFTQVVWKGTTQVGMGTAKDGKGGQYIVANYQPPGNVIGQFAENVPRPL